MGTSFFPNLGGIPRGTICLWYGTIATIPTGWAFCNGSNGTPDLRNRFILCGVYDDAGVVKPTVYSNQPTGGGDSVSAGVTFTSEPSGNFGTTSGDTTVLTPGLEAEVSTFFAPFYKTAAYIMKL